MLHGYDRLRILYKTLNVDYGEDYGPKQIIDFMDALGIEQADFVEAVRRIFSIIRIVNHPERVRNIIMMGPMGVEFDISYGLNEVWGYQPSPENMMKMIDLFTFNKKFTNEELANVRYQASMGSSSKRSVMFPGHQSKVQTIYPSRMK